MRRIYILDVRPSIDGGRYPAKAVAGDPFAIEADLVADGHDKLAGLALYRAEGETEWSQAVLRPRINDRWFAEVRFADIGPHEYCVMAWVDDLATWRYGLGRRLEVGQDISAELLVGSQLMAAAARRAGGRDADLLQSAADRLADPELSTERRTQVAFDELVADAAARNPDRQRATTSEVYRAFVERPRARFSAWYEFFPRSTGPGTQHGTFQTAETMLDYVADLGFDIVYLPPIHPIGRTHRKGRNNSLRAEPGDPGSPWAIGANEGGHMAVHPELGTLEDFRRFRARAEKLGLEVALDIAFQTSPDHPYVHEHPEWFYELPDGSIRYAENPPKRYEDIHPFDFTCDAWPELWKELLDVFLFWIDQGVRTFRVDNPHTKSFRFWEWCIGELRQRQPDVILLAEAFARPRLMYLLGKLGFSQSYTYFTWRNTAWELERYMEELTRTEVKEFLRPNFWPNTPDILPEHLQHGGPPAFTTRLVLAATMAANYGIYGPAFELMESVPRPGSEEYLDNEKYELKDWDLDAAHSLRHMIKRVNAIRREHPALQHNRINFHHSDNEHLLCYSKRDPAGDDVVLCVVNLDPYHRHAGWISLDMAALGLDHDAQFQVHDMLGDARYLWRGNRQYIELHPQAMPAHVLRVLRRSRRESDFEYFM